MTEALINEQPLPVVPDRFNRLPYCLPEVGYFDVESIIRDFNPEAVAQDPDFYRHLSACYWEDKGDPHAEDAEHPKPPEPEVKKPKEPTFDLREPGSLEGMISHTLVHSIAGFIESGTSNTDCIPYWDRDAVKVALKWHDPTHAAERLQVVDALSMNVLRAHCDYLSWSIPFYRTQVELLEEAIPRGQVSKMSMHEEQEEILPPLKKLANRHTSLYLAKLKHLIWLVDQQEDPNIRWYMESEITNRVTRAHELGFTTEDLTIDLGADAGISQETNRPPYDISMFVQLAHLHEPGASEQIYSLPQEDCHRLSLRTMLSSIRRSDFGLPAYEQDGRYRLPWNFVNRQS